MLSESFKSQKRPYQTQLIQLETDFIVSFETDMKENEQFSSLTCRQ